MPTEPTIADVLNEVRRLCKMVEKHLPDAVSSQQERAEREMREAKRRSAAERAAAKAAGRDA